MGKYQTKIIIVACFLASAIGMFLILKGRKEDVSGSIKPAYVPPIANATAPKLTEVLSPDGKVELRVKEEKTKEGTIYIFSINTKSTGVTQQVFTKTVPLGSLISVPFNTFSPDNKYLLLKEENQSTSTYFVISGTETPISETSQTLDISSTFMAKYEDYKITDVTGWGGMNLVVVNTDKKSGGIGPSFWFEVPSQSLIQLSGRFD